MKKTALGILMLVMIGMMMGCTAAEADPNGRAVKIGGTESIGQEEYVLTFCDEFDGKRLDRRNWETCPEWDRSDRGARWEKDCARVQDGKLVLSVQYDEKEKRCLSGGVRTLGKFEQAYGYYEICMKVQDEPGFWSAFWMMCGDVQNVDGSAEDGVELDIAEAFHVEQKGMNYALHWDGYGEEHRTVVKTDSLPEIYDGEFHVFAARWAKDGYTWYVDGEEMWKVEDENLICTQPGYMKITTEVGSWAGEIDREQLPGEIEVEYVRAYQFSGEKGKQ